MNRQLSNEIDLSGFMIEKPAEGEDAYAIFEKIQQNIRKADFTEDQKKDYALLGDKITKYMNHYIFSDAVMMLEIGEKFNKEFVYEKLLVPERRFMQIDPSTLKDFYILFDKLPFKGHRHIIVLKKLTDLPDYAMKGLVLESLKRGYGQGYTIAVNKVEMMTRSGLPEIDYDATITKIDPVLDGVSGFDESSTLSLYEHSAQQFETLLIAGYDIFGLIDEGYAFDRALLTDEEKGRLNKLLMV